MKTKKPEMVKTTLRLPKQIFQAAKVRAIHEERNLQDILADALEAYLKTKIKKAKGGKK